ncbi:WD40 repeat-like protein [Vararia minispora EC-137]|uniref:WD40 repeat-like protein n=1 Tax=Vararia minispora EC-137 TaxID=1314806 RepID=A0ACB8QDS8_9AGAM|nr:WD40 repeat-like protein [Vararia minispora EC-137]
MAPTHEIEQTGEDEGEDDAQEFIEAGDVYAEVDDDDDAMMDEDADDLGELPAGVDEDEIVYEDDSIQHFTAHRKSVFTVASHPSAPLAVSGGEDDLGYIWDIETGKTVVKLSGHSDSVACVAFSSDGEMVSTGGMDGRVRIWRRVGKQDWKTWEFLTELQGPDEVMWLKWHPKGPVLLAGSNDSTVWLWQLPSGNTMQVFAGHTGPVTCGDFTPDGKRILTACNDNTLIYWDPRDPTPIFKLTAQDGRFDLDGITTLAVNPASTLAVIGGAAGGVRVVSLTKGEVIAALGTHDEGQSVEAAVFVNVAGATVGGSALATTGGGTVVTGATDGKACVWDLNTNRLRTLLTHQDSVTSLHVHPTKAHLLISASADGALRTWDVRTGTLLREHKGHRGAVLGASLAMGGDVILSASDDGKCLVFATE